MRLAPLTPADYLRWYPLWQDYLTFYEHPLPEETTRHTFERICAQAEGMRGVLLGVDDEAVGFAITLDHPSTWSQAPKCYLEDLFVAESHRGRSLGRALVEHVYARARARGCTQVYWQTGAKNVAGRRLYDRVGTLSDWVKYEHRL